MFTEKVILFKNVVKFHVHISPVSVLMPGHIFPLQNVYFATRKFLCHDCDVRTLYNSILIKDLLG